MFSLYCSVSNDEDEIFRKKIEKNVCLEVLVASWEMLCNMLYLCFFFAEMVARMVFVDMLVTGAVFLLKRGR